MQEVGVVGDGDIRSSIITEYHQVGLMVRVQVLRQVLQHHVVVFYVDERFVVLEEVLKRAVLDGQRCIPSRIDTDATWEVVQIKKHSVAFVVHLLVRINLKELCMVRHSRFSPQTTQIGVRRTLGSFLIKVCLDLEIGILVYGGTNNTVSRSTRYAFNVLLVDVRLLVPSGSSRQFCFCCHSFILLEVERVDIHRLLVR